MKASGLEFKVFESAADLSKAAAAIVFQALKAKPDLILCASAGGTPTGMYQQLALLCSRNPRLFARMRILQIDEWGGLDPRSPATCRIDLQRKLLKPLHVAQNRFVGFRTNAPDPEAECRRIRAWLNKKGPIDICILGLGLNGHIAMNEPAPRLELSVHQAKLTPASRRHAMLQGLSNKPRFGYTLGMADILGSQKILLLVSGSHKRQILRKLQTPQVSTQLPASFLWLHPGALVLCDAAAAHGHPSV